MTITDCRNFNLLITRAGERCLASMVDAPAVEAEGDFLVRHRRNHAGSR